MIIGFDFIPPALRWTMGPPSATRRSRSDITHSCHSNIPPYALLGVLWCVVQQQVHRIHYSAAWSTHGTRQHTRQQHGTPWAHKSNLLHTTSAALQTQDRPLHSSSGILGRLCGVDLRCPWERCALPCRQSCQRHKRPSRLGRTWWPANGPPEV
jgi:hypothetical protein